MAEWDNAHFLTKGADLSSLGAYGTLIAQAIEEAFPAATWYGGMIVAEDTPPVTGDYTWHKRCLWYKPTAQLLYYYSDFAGSWDTIDKLIDLTPANESITLAKLSTSGTAARRVLRRNAANTAYEWCDPADIFNTGEVTLTKLEAPPAAGYTIVSVGTTPTWVLFSAQFATQLAATDLPFNKIKDTAGAGVAGQVGSLVGANDYFEFSYVEDLLRANTTLTNRLNWSAVVSPGKYLRINSLGTDVEGVDASTIATPSKVAVLSYGGAMGTAPQSVTTGAVRTIQFNQEQDPSSILTLAANQITFAATGTYLFRASVPVYPTGGGGAKVSVLVRDITAGTELDAASCYCYNGNGYSGTAMIETIVTVTDIATVYELSIDVDAGVTLFNGPAMEIPNRNSHVERFQRLTITKIS